MITKKTTTGSITLGLLMCVALSFNSCKTKEAEPEIPDFTKGYENVKPLPAVTPSTPAAVTSTPASVKASPALLEVGTALASETVAPAVTKASEDIGKAVSSAKATELVNAFTPAVLASLKSGGALPAALQSEMALLKANPALAAYLPTVTPATVNGAPVNGLVPVKLGTNATEPMFFGESINAVAAVNSACTDQALAAYNTAAKVINDSKGANDKTVNDTFDALLAAVNPASCKAAAASAAATQLAEATAIVDASITGIDAGIAKGLLTQAAGLNLKTLFYFVFTNQVSSIASMRASSEAACDAVATAQRDAINVARKNDLDAIAASLSTALAPLKATLEANMKTCHDQGMGGN
jgi:hypothetical protein